MAVSTKATHIAGPDLAAARVRQGVRAVQVARHIGMSRQRVSQIEHLWRVPRDVADRYLRAVSELAA